MAVVHVTIIEGGKWFMIDWEQAQHFISDYPPNFFTAIRFGDNIYDFILAKNWHNPWRKYGSPNTRIT